MPIYEYRCPKCAVLVELFQRLHDAHPVCKNCHVVMTKLLSAPRINMGVGPYGRYDETLQTHVGTNKQWRDEMRKQDVTPMGDTPKHGKAWV